MNLLLIPKRPNPMEKTNRFLCGLLFLLTSLVYRFLAFNAIERTESLLSVLSLLGSILGSYLLVQLVYSFLSTRKEEDRKSAFWNKFLSLEPFYFAILLFLLLPLGVKGYEASLFVVVSLLVTDLMDFFLQRKVDSIVLAYLLIVLVFSADFVPYLSSGEYIPAQDGYLLSDISTNEKLGSFLFTPLSLWENYIGLGFGPIGSRNFLVITVLGLYLCLSHILDGKTVFFSLVFYYFGLLVFFLSMQDGSWAFPDSLRYFFCSDYAFLAVFLGGLEKKEDLLHSLLFSLGFSFFSLLFCLTGLTTICSALSLLLMEFLSLGVSYLPMSIKKRPVTLSFACVLALGLILLPMFYGLNHPLDPMTGTYL